MRKKSSLVVAGLLAGATMAMTGASPAQAQNCQSAGDPVIGYVCTIVNNAPEPGPTLDYYYYAVTGLVHTAYCTVSPYC